MHSRTFRRKTTRHVPLCSSLLPPPPPSVPMISVLSGSNVPSSSLSLSPLAMVASQLSLPIGLNHGSSSLRSFSTDTKKNYSFVSSFHRTMTTGISSASTGKATSSIPKNKGKDSKNSDKEKNKSMDNNAVGPVSMPPLTPVQERMILSAIASTTISKTTGELPIIKNNRSSTSSSSAASKASYTEYPEDESKINTPSSSSSSLSPLLTMGTASSMSGITLSSINDTDTLENLLVKVNILKDTNKPWGTNLVLGILQRTCQLYQSNVSSLSSLVPSSSSFVSSVSSSSSSSSSMVIKDPHYYVRNILSRITWELGRRKQDNQYFLREQPQQQHHPEEPQKSTQTDSVDYMKENDNKYNESLDSLSSSSSASSLFIGLTTEQYAQLLEYLVLLQSYHSTLLEDSIHTSAANAFLLTTSSAKMLKKTSTRTLVTILELGQKLNQNKSINPEDDNNNSNAAPSSVLLTKDSAPIEHVILEKLCRQSVNDTSASFSLSPIPTTVSYWSNHRNMAISYVRIVSELVHRLDQSNTGVSRTLNNTNHTDEDTSLSSTSVGTKESSVRKKNRKRTWKITQLATLADIATNVIMNEFYYEAVRLLHRSNEALTLTSNDPWVLYRLPTVQHSISLLRCICHRSISSEGLPRIQNIIEGYWKGKATPMSANPSGNTSASSASDQEFSATVGTLSSNILPTSVSSPPTSLPFHGTKDAPAANAHEWIPKFLRSLAVILQYRLIPSTDTVKENKPNTGLSLPLVHQCLENLLAIVQNQYRGALETGQYVTHHVLRAKQIRKQQQRNAHEMIDDENIDDDVTNTENILLVSSSSLLDNNSIDWIAVRSILSTTEGMNMNSSQDGSTLTVHPKYATMVTAMENSVSILSSLNQILHHINMTSSSLTTDFSTEQPIPYSNALENLLQSIIYTPYILCPGEPEMYFTRSKWTALRSSEVLKTIAYTVEKFYPEAVRWNQPHNSMEASFELLPWKRNEVPFLLTIQMYIMATLMSENPVHDRLTVRTTRNTPNQSTKSILNVNPIFSTPVKLSRNNSETFPSEYVVWTDTLLENYSLLLQYSLQLGISPQLPIPKMNNRSQTVIADPLEYMDAMVLIRQFYYRYGTDVYGSLVDENSEDNDRDAMDKDTFRDSIRLLEFTYTPYITVITSRLHRRLENLRNYVAKHNGSINNTVPKKSKALEFSTVTTPESHVPLLSSSAKPSSASTNEDIHRRVRVLRSKLQHQQYQTTLSKRNYSRYIVSDRSFWCTATPHPMHIYSGVLHKSIALFSGAINSNNYGKSIPNLMYLSSTTTQAITNTVLILLRQLSFIYRKSESATPTGKENFASRINYDSIYLCLQQLSFLLTKWRSFTPLPTIDSPRKPNESTNPSIILVPLYIQGLKEKLYTSSIRRKIEENSTTKELSSKFTVANLKSCLLDAYRALERMNGKENFPNGTTDSASTVHQRYPKLSLIYQDLTLFCVSVFEYLQTEKVMLSHEDFTDIVCPLMVYVTKYFVEAIVTGGINVPGIMPVTLTITTNTVYGTLFIRCLEIFLEYLKQDQALHPNNEYYYTGQQMDNLYYIYHYGQKIIEQLRKSSSLSSSSDADVANYDYLSKTFTWIENEGWHIIRNIVKGNKVNQSPKVL